MVNYSVAMDYQQAIKTIAAIQASEGSDIQPVSHTKLMTHGQKTGYAIVFFHGYTSSPQQFTPLGERCFKLGYNVYIPRLPHHGYASTLTDATKYVNAKELAAEADRAVDIARELGEHLIVAGLSMGGVLTAWEAQRRPEIARAIVISPAFGAHTFPARWLWLISHGLLLLPDTIRWWDAEKKEKTGGPFYAYPRFSTHGLMQIFRLGFQVRAMARRSAPSVRQIWMVLNDNDTAVDNAINRQLVADWKHSSTTQVESYTFPKELELPHDIISMESPKQHTDVVYPVLLKLIQGESL
jgi:pimeloyl-ACP methyl ester carboxylesterase